MRLSVRPLKRILTAALLAAGGLTLAGSALADYTGPDRVVSTFSWERRVCEYEAVYDPPGSGYYGCGLTLYETPDSSCPSNSSVKGYFNPSACGWPSDFCSSPGCDISRSSSIESCRSGEQGCRQVESQTTLPEAMVGGSVDCGSPGSGGWCRGGASLSLSGGEPLAGESIFLIEGTHNGTPFACDGSSCSLPLVEGGNDFSFWAHSTFGDTSRMDSASGLVDSGDPSLSGSISGTGGDNGWFVSSVTITASANDAVSGLASLDVKINGGGWASYGGPVSLGDGSHDVELRAVDVAGNTATQSLSVDVDTISPFADLDAVPSFCPGCGETLGILVIVQDSGSGIADWDLTASGAGVAGGGSAVNQTVVWDGGGLGGGLHTLVLEARDRAGNEASAGFGVNLILPTPTPTDEPTETPVPTATSEPASLFSLFSEPTATRTPPPGASPTSVRSPTSTRTPLTFTFGGPPAAPLGGGDGDSISNLQSPSGDPVSISNLPPPGVYYGGAALALGAAAAAYAADQRRRRREEEASQREEMARANAEAEAAEKARAQAIADAREEAEWKEILLGIIGASTAAQLFTPKDDEDEPPRPGSLEWKERMLEPHIPPEPPPPPPFDLAKWKQQDYAAGQAWERERAYLLYRESELANAPPSLFSWLRGSWITRALKTVRTVLGIREASAITLNPLESGHVSVRVSPNIAVGEKVPLRIRFGLRGTRYNPATAQQAISMSRVRSAVSRAGIFTTLGIVLAGNLYDYTIGERREEGLGPNFIASVAVDFAVALLVGLAAAIAVVGVLGFLGVTLPAWGTAAIVAGVAMLFGLAVDAAGIPAVLKDSLGSALGSLNTDADTPPTVEGTRGGTTAEGSLVENHED